MIKYRVGDMVIINGAFQDADSYNNYYKKHKTVPTGFNSLFTISSVVCEIIEAYSARIGTSFIRGEHYRIKPLDTRHFKVNWVYWDVELLSPAEEIEL